MSHRPRSPPFTRTPPALQDFVVSGTASEKLFGMAESLWEPDLEPEDLFETVSQTLLNAVDRDAYSGWGAVVWIVEKVRLSFSSAGGPMNCGWSARGQRRRDEGPRQRPGRVRRSRPAEGGSSCRLEENRTLRRGSTRALRDDSDPSSPLLSQDKVTKRWLKARMD